ncbi:MAG: hypothetical protein ACRCSM_05400 [Sediminibacterium sp.]|nr:hypothetical protein [Sediminibacterium sp.]MCA6441026.1 hypothetical protein [Chitinophagaceae bacterium]MCA6448224.1 hypothetical protein [Chitinophagaceae bacterium]
MKAIFIVMLLCSFSFISKTKSNNRKESISKNLMPFFSSTLDSLQGTWVSIEDVSAKIIITNNLMYSYYENICNDTSKLILADGCIAMEVSNYDKTKVNGKYLILYNDEYLEYNSCYRIGYLSNTSLDLYYDGKRLAYNKQ